jgi:hypothetical protein
VVVSSAGASSMVTLVSASAAILIDSAVASGLRNDEYTRVDGWMRDAKIRDTTTKRDAHEIQRGREEKRASGGELAKRARSNSRAMAGSGQKRCVENSNAAGGCAVVSLWNFAVFVHFFPLPPVSSVSPLLLLYPALLLLLFLLLLTALARVLSMVHRSCCVELSSAPMPATLGSTDGVSRAVPWKRLRAGNATSVPFLHSITTTSSSTSSCYFHAPQQLHQLHQLQQQQHQLQQQQQQHQHASAKAIASLSFLASLESNGGSRRVSSTSISGGSSSGSRPRLSRVNLASGLASLAELRPALGQFGKLRGASAPQVLAWTSDLKAPFAIKKRARQVDDHPDADELAATSKRPRLSSSSSDVGADDATSSSSTTAAALCQSMQWLHECIAELDANELEFLGDSLPPYPYSYASSYPYVSSYSPFPMQYPDQCLMYPELTEFGQLKGFSNPTLLPPEPILTFADCAPLEQCHSQLLLCDGMGSRGGIDIDNDSASCCSSSSCNSINSFINTNILDSSSSSSSSPTNSLSSSSLSSSSLSNSCNISIDDEAIDRSTTVVTTEVRNVLGSTNLVIPDDLLRKLKRPIYHCNPSIITPSIIDCITPVVTTSSIAAASKVVTTTTTTTTTTTATTMASTASCTPAPTPTTSTGATDGKMQLASSAQSQASSAVNPGDEFVNASQYCAMSQGDAAKILGIAPSTLSKRWKEATNGRVWPWRAVCGECRC